MVQTQLQHLKSRMERDVLVLTVTESQIHTDAVADALRHDLIVSVTDSGARNVVLDFQQVQSLSSTGIRPLISLRRHLRDKNGRIVLCNLAPIIARVFANTRMVNTSGSSSALFDIAPDVPAAIARLGQGTPG